MKAFNKKKEERKLKLKQNKNTYIKRLSISLACAILLFVVILFTYARFEVSSEEFVLINGVVSSKRSVTLHPNGGTLSNTTVKLPIGEVITNLPIPTNETKDFEGWYLDSALTQKVTSSTIMTTNISDLYAKYKPYKIVSGDLATIGSVVKIANEEFYVMGQEDSTHVKLLSKWNLNVGDNPKGTATGLQDSDVRGYVSGGTTYGNIAFSSTNYWYDGSALKPAYGSSYPAYVYDSNASIKTYVDTYVTYLNNQGVNVSGRLIKQEELVSLGCNASTGYCDTSGTHGGTAPSWVYQTSYWSGSAFGYFVWDVYSVGGFDVNVYDYGSRFGVRPVIILEK